MCFKWTQTAIKNPQYAGVAQWIERQYKKCGVDNFTNSNVLGGLQVVGSSPTPCTSRLGETAAYNGSPFYDGGKDHYCRVSAATCGCSSTGRATDNTKCVMA